MLSPLQERVAALTSSLAENEGFALAGASALILRGDVQRTTMDLDFFATSPEAVGRVLPSLEAALTATGLQVERVRVAEGFARLEVSDGDQSTTVDLCWDSRLWPTERTRLGPVLAGEELAASKTLALFTRAEARDFVDVFALARRYGFDRLTDVGRAVALTGDWDEGRRWWPDEAEHRPCCERVRAPSRAWPWSLMVHCRTARHVSALFGVGERSLTTAAGVVPPLRRL